jgi:hypothetical protein
MMKTWLNLLSVMIAIPGLQAQARERTTVAAEFTEEMAWFKDARFGIFIHWGIYAVNGDGASWPVFNEKISREDYMKQADSFTADNYDPAAWAELFRDAGARYAVLTTKHHDGMPGRPLFFLAGLGQRGLWLPRENEKERCEKEDPGFDGGVGAVSRIQRYAAQGTVRL